ncbi:sulfotransferase family protein [Phaeobacter gallaeciensis]|uniref:sulfotransferase family protein n=2 Tax=Phaeobacter gallaeciensis TaxID=60890 RepID=UPI00237FC512|nr:sulfotransferase [Phaeobacter gallaeciensis]MDE4305598.1 sulfotransferase [Phaeobacter gallaeciensis]MDE4327842.1 sulfotransferase [Phaeobacter gallaeciensis]MDE4332140.1 sulfotransferase [Phaeobacter gallaeciensis]MDE4341066.1 sulfotransferase [Phaeobacter gallaeciensis]MDE4358918.1 sulfotransferase [Phaeobacter gallaeciensis]
MGGNFLHVLGLTADIRTATLTKQSRLTTAKPGQGQTMKLPNTLIVGAQKSGTTWLHHSLKKSEQVFASKPKELNFFLRQNPEKELADYAAHFEDNCAPIRLESSPGYFRLPERHCVARSIKRCLPQVKIILSLRNPVDRYLSAYTHHIQAGRLPYTPVIDELRDDLRMVSFGMYADILAHWQTVFPDMLVLLYNEIDTRPMRIIRRIENHLDVELGLNRSDLRFRVNDADRKVRRGNISDAAKKSWQGRPSLSPELRAELHELYREQVDRLADMTGFDLSAWQTATIE